MIKSNVINNFNIRNFAGMNYTFKAQERLKSTKQISKLFSSGKSLSSYPLKLIYTPLEEKDFSSLQEMQDVKVKFGVSVSKRRFKTAVSRNRVKRLIREAYRLEKPYLYQKIKRPYAFMIIYLSDEILPFAEVQKKMSKLLEKFNQKIQDD
jgi:ribonuclease P protein component